MPTFYLTFGQCYLSEVHPTFPAAHPDGWVELIAPTADAARALAAEHFTDSEGAHRWAWIYPAHHFQPHHCPRGCLARFTASPLPIEQAIEALQAKLEAPAEAELLRLLSLSVNELLYLLGPKDAERLLEMLDLTITGWKV